MHPEFASYMLEVTPTEPFEGFFNPKEVRDHFYMIYSILSKNTMCETLFGLSVFPTMGKNSFYINEQN